MSDLIDRQAAIDALKAARVEDDGTYQWRTQRNLDLEFAAALLENIPPAQPASCEDAVSRKAVAGIYTALWETIGTIMDRDEWDDVCKATANELPPAQPERIKGHWIHDGHHIRCDQCREYMCDKDAEGDRIPTNFCPNCGAEMEVTE